MLGGVTTHTKVLGGTRLTAVPCSPVGFLAVLGVHNLHPLQQRSVLGFKGKIEGLRT